MSSRRRVDPAAIDEALIRDLIGGHTPALAPRAASPPVPDAAERPKGEALPPDDYARLYLSPHKIRERGTCVIALDNKRKLEFICKCLGEGLSLSALVDNILRHHIETYRDQLNEMIRNMTNKPTF